MKHTELLLLALLLLLTLTGCGKEAAAVPETETQGLLLVESRPAAVPTETEAPNAPTLPAFVEEARKPEATQPTGEETKPAETQPETKATEVPRPVVTKSPTKESAAAGGEAWFVAHAEGADGVRWWFTAPGSTEKQDGAALRKAFPELTLQGPETDTLALFSLPRELDGWSVTAEFYNGSGSSYSEAAVISVTEAPTGVLSPAYASVLENCRFVLRYDPSRDSAQTLGQNDLYQLYDGHELLDGGLGYALLDVNGNGVEELVIGCAGTNRFGDRGGDMIYAMFTLREGFPVKILQSWSTNRFYLSKGGRIYQEEDSGNGITSFTRMDLLEAQLIPVEVLWTEGADSSGTVQCFYSPNGSRDPTSRQHVTDPRFYEVQSSMIASRLPLPELTDILPY